MSRPPAAESTPAKAEPNLAKLGLDRSVMARRDGLRLPVSLPYDSWRRVGKQLALISDSSAWWLGDWLIFGESQYCNRYVEAVRETSLDYQTLRNYAWVARKIPMSRRRDTLSFQHHAEVAALDERLQEHWLTLAVEGGWSRNQLRRQLRTSRTAAKRPPAQLPVPEVVTVQVNADVEQQRHWCEAAERARRPVQEWVVSVLDQEAAAILEKD